MAETNEEVVVDTNTNGGEGNENEADFVKIPKKDYEALNQTLGSLKRENKDLKKPKDEPIETPKNQPDNTLLEKSFLRSAGITAKEEVEEALTTSKKWGMPIDQLIDDPDFQVKLDKIRTQKSNELATSNVKGGPGTSQAKNTLEYWMAKGQPPTPADVPDRAARQKIVVAMMKESKNGGKKFYND